MFMEKFIEQVIGPNSPEMYWWQMLLRAVTIFFIALLFIRLGGTRIFGANTSFDIVVGITLGSILSRAITGNSPYFPTIISAGALVLLHWILSWVVLRSRFFGSIIKGNRILLVKDGKYLKSNMNKTHITHHDLLEALRSKGALKYQKKNLPVWKEAAI